MFCQMPWAASMFHFAYRDPVDASYLAVRTRVCVVCVFSCYWVVCMLCVCVFYSTCLHEQRGTVYTVLGSHEFNPTLTISWAG